LVISQIPQLDIKLRYWQDITGFDKSGFYGVFSIYHNPLKSCAVTSLFALLANI